MSKSHFDSTWDRKELSKSVISIVHQCRPNITNFEICEFHKNSKI